MQDEDLNKLKVDYTKRNIEYWVSELIKRQDNLLFLQAHLDELSKKKKLSEDDKKIRDIELPPNIEGAIEKIANAEVHIEGLQKLLSSYEENKPLKI